MEIRRKTQIFFRIRSLCSTHTACQLSSSSTCSLILYCCSPSETNLKQSRQQLSTASYIFMKILKSFSSFYTSPIYLTAEIVFLTWCCYRLPEALQSLVSRTCWATHTYSSPLKECQWVSEGLHTAAIAYRQVKYLQVLLHSEVLWQVQSSPALYALYHSSFKRTHSTKTALTVALINPFYSTLGLVPSPLGWKHLLLTSY